MRALSCIVLVALVPGCWPDFPDSRFHVDASVNGDGKTDGPGQGDAARDKGPPHDGPRIEGPKPPDLRPDFSGTCTPGQFVACVGKWLEKCNATGDGLVTVSCVPFDCNPIHGYCNECNIGQSPKCVKDALETCSAEGLLKTTPCGPLGCKTGKCCTDTDGDTYLSCADDCNDNDKQVNPGQTAFFPVASKNSFDYNCDKVEEPEFPGAANCVKGAGGVCTGAGWTTAVPACGQSGSFADCVNQGGSCVQQVTTKTQRCR
jgi:hypothetical protein